MCGLYVCVRACVFVCSQVTDTSNLIQSPMPGTLISISVEEGQFIEAGQEVAVVEAMKMQNVLRAPRAGTVKAVHCAAGASLKVDQVIASLESASDQLDEGVLAA
mmetsp:Transcript_15520/g.26374  ORF Transcript_15520/g.26374 Transcript_15520/m.26374 type:complete len:105 (-) Transcript_15520:309-623(-)